MALTDEGGNMVMPVGPMNGNGGFGDMGGNGWWIILLFLLLGFGNNWNNGGYGGAGVQEGFNQAALTSGLSAIQSSINDVQGAICNGFSQAEIANNTRQMADMQQMFALQQQFSTCCCENKAGIESLRNTISTENCADRQAINDALVNVITQMNAGFQSMKDEFCQDRLDRKDEKIAELTAINNELSRQASSNNQTATILANNEAQTIALERYLAPQPSPAYIVPNPNCCNQTYGCSCAVG